MTKTTELPVVEIEATAGTQVRRYLDSKVIDAYAEDMEAGANFPPLIVFAENGSQRYILADGFHRLAAAKKAKAKNIACEVRDGRAHDALGFALGANSEHGFRRSDKDKRNAVELALKDPEWSAWNNVEISRLCRVSEKLVRTMRREMVLAGEIDEPETVKTTRNGKVVEQKASNGKSETYTRSAQTTSSVLPEKSGASKKQKLTDEQKRIAKQVRESVPKPCPHCKGTGWL